MDNELINELENIINMDDLENSRIATIRLITYMLTIQTTQNTHPILEQFLEHAYSILPSSVLPNAFKVHFNLTTERRRKVAFGKTLICELKTKQLNNEAKIQALREGQTLSLVNTDLYKKFRPKTCIEQGIKNETNTVGTRNLNFYNLWKGPLIEASKSIIKIDYNLDEIIKNPSILNVFK